MINLKRGNIAAAAAGMAGAIVAAAMLLIPATAGAALPDGMIAVKSPHDAKETMNRLESVVKEKGLNVFARVDHAAGAAKIGKTLRPTELLIFGNPQGGTPFIECAQTVGICLLYTSPSPRD